LNVSFLVRKYTANRRIATRGILNLWGGEWRHTFANKEQQLL